MRGYTPGFDPTEQYRKEMGEEATARQEALASAMKTQSCACQWLPGPKPEQGKHKIGCPRG